MYGHVHYVSCHVPEGGFPSVARAPMHDAPVLVVEDGQVDESAAFNVVVQFHLHIGSGRVFPCHIHDIRCVEKVGNLLFPLILHIERFRLFLVGLAEHFGQPVFLPLHEVVSESFPRIERDERMVVGKEHAPFMPQSAVAPLWCEVDGGRQAMRPQYGHAQVCIFLAGSRLDMFECREGEVGKELRRIINDGTHASQNVVGHAIGIGGVVLVGVVCFAHP